MDLRSDDFDYTGAIRACAREDVSALRRLYERDGAYLLGVAHRIVRDRQTAEDVVHDAFINAWTRAHTFDASKGSGRGWLFSIVRHLALDAARAKGRSVEIPDEEGLDAMLRQYVTPHAAHRDEDALRLGRLAGCLDALDDNKRTSIIHAYVDGYSHGEIAALLKAPLGSVKAWVRRGLLSLRECLE